MQINYIGPQSGIFTGFAAQNKRIVARYNSGGVLISTQAPVNKLLTRGGGRIVLRL